MKTDTLIGKKVKRLSDGKEVTIRNERIVGDLCIYTDTMGNIYEEGELDIRYSVTPWYLLYEALLGNGIVEDEDWNSEVSFKRAFNSFMEAMQKAGYIANEQGGN